MSDFGAALLFTFFVFLAVGCVLLLVVSGTTKSKQRLAVVTSLPIVPAIDGLEREVMALKRRFDVYDQWQAETAKQINARHEAMDRIVTLLESAKIELVAGSGDVPAGAAPPEFPERKKIERHQEVIDVKDDLADEVVDPYVQRRSVRVDDDIPANILLDIDYVDVDDVATQRRVHVRALSRNENREWYLKSYCYMRRRVRSFRVDRVVEAIDAHTGEVLAGDDLIRAVKDSGAGPISAFVREHSAAMVVLCYMCLADTDMADAEIAVVSDWMRMMGCDGPAQERAWHVRQIEPTARHMDDAVRAIKQMPQTYQRDLFVTAQGVAAAVGGVVPEEQAILDRIAKAWKIDLDQVL